MKIKLISFLCLLSLFFTSPLESESENLFLSQESSLRELIELFPSKKNDSTDENPELNLSFVEIIKKKG